MSTEVQGFAQRILAADGGHEKVLSAVEWLTVYTSQSANMAPQFITPQFAQKILAPLVKVVPYVPVRTQLYWISTSGKASPKRVASFTALDNPKDWEDLADSIGAEEATVYKMQNFRQLSSYLWAAKIGTYLKGLELRDNRIEDFQEVLDYAWQKEVICQTSPSTKHTVVHQFD